MKTVSSIRKNVIDILETNDIKYQMDDYKIITEYKEYREMDKIAGIISNHVPREDITFNIRENSCSRLCSLEIDPGANRDEILKQLDGTEYQEHYGIFTTDRNETFITAVLDIEPETSLSSLLRSEDNEVDIINTKLRCISEYNNSLRSAYAYHDKKSYASLIRNRNDAIECLERSQRKLSKIRKKIQDNYGIKMR